MHKDMHKDKNEDNLLSPYIMFHKKNKEFTAYIPYKITDNKSYELDYPHTSFCTLTQQSYKLDKYNCPIQEIAISSILMCKLLGLPADKKEYNLSYTYDWNDTIFEVGIFGTDLDKIYDSIKNIQSLLKSKICCEIDDNFYNINIYINEVTLPDVHTGRL